MATLFKFVKFPKNSKVTTRCFCYFCKGKRQREDVEHLKLFYGEGAPEREYYMSICYQTGELVIEQKL